MHLLNTFKCWFEYCRAWKSPILYRQAQTLQL